MNARVLLLVLVTGLFMAAWDSDQTAMEAAIVRRDIRIANARMALLEKPATEMRTASASANSGNLEHSLTVAHVSESPSVTTTELEGDDVAIPLPKIIAAGNYQAINQSSGESVRLSIDEAAASSTSPQDFYTVDGDKGERWYLIRIAGEPTARL